MTDLRTDFSIVTAPTGPEPWSLNDALATALGGGELLRLTADSPGRGAAPRGTIYLRPGLWSWNADRAETSTLPREVELWVAPGARIVVSRSRGTDRRVRVLGTFRAGLHPVFTHEGDVGAGRESIDVVFSPWSCAVLRPEWWATLSLVGVMDHVALQRALDVALASASEFGAYPVVELTRQVVLGALVRLSMVAGIAGSSRLTLRGRSTVMNGIDDDPVPLASSFAAIDTLTAPIASTTAPPTGVSGVRSPTLPLAAQISVLDGFVGSTMFSMQGATRVLLEQLSFDGRDKVATAVSLQASSTRVLGDEVLLRGCDLRGATDSLVHLVAPEGTAVPGTPSLRVSLLSCRLDGGTARGSAQRNVGLLADSSDYLVSAEVTAFVGGAAAMISAHGAKVDLAACWFDNRAECLFTLDGQKTPRPHREGDPYQGIDVSLQPEPRGLGASMMARLCRSTSDLFLFRDTPGAGPQHPPSHLMGVLHEPAQRSSPASVIWAGNARDETLTLTGCTLLAKTASFFPGGLPLRPAQIPVWLDGANPCVLDIGTVQSTEESVFYRRSATVVQAHVRTLTFRDAAGHDVSVEG